MTIFLQIPLPDEPPWFQLFGASEEDLKEICTRILRLYSLPHVSFSSLLRHVDQCRQALDEAKVKLGTNPIGTPTLEPPTCFSPASASKTGDNVLNILCSLHFQWKAAQFMLVKQ